MTWAMAGAGLAGWLASSCLAAMLFSCLKRRQRARQFAAFVVACEERLAADLKRYEVDGVELRAIAEDAYDAPLSALEAEEMQRRIAFGLLACSMARALRHPAPLQARA